jgi:hypothetical protein
LKRRQAIGMLGALSVSAMGARLGAAQFERFKTGIQFDGTARNPQWMG